MVWGFVYIQYWLCVWCLVGLFEHLLLLGDVLLSLLDDLLPCLCLLGLFLVVSVLSVTIFMGPGPT